jgi:large subunit ribosomal protein L30e
MTLKTDITNAMKNKKLLIGLNSVMKAVKAGDAEKVVVANNCSEAMRIDINNYSSVSGVKVEIFEGNNRELGTLCKKPFPISVLAVKKG